MLVNLQFRTDLVTFTEDNFYGKLFCAVQNTGKISQMQETGNLLALGSVFLYYVNQLISQTLAKTNQNSLV